MSAYLQMGHDTENLVGETDLGEFTGIVLSPVNRDSPTLAQNVATFRGKGEYDIVFDPQLYLPTSDRGCLPEQPYFPTDIDTADLTSDSWWTGIVNKLVPCVAALKVDAVASPVVLPRAWSDDYFAHCAETSDKLAAALSTSGIRSLTTVMVNFNEMGEKDSALRIASIVSEADSAGYYLVIVSDIEPRREMVGEDQLAGVMMLIHELEKTGQPVVVSHCSSDMILFKAAGAKHCATGKFFNLRRFTKSRYEEPASGGGQLPYWFEHSLLAFIRGTDLRRLQENGLGHLVGVGASNNYWSQKILDQFATDPTAAWVALGWRQYLSWFGKTELTLSAADPLSIVRTWLKSAEDNWRVLEDAGVLMDEPRNDGSWIRSWRQTETKFRKAINP
jgi:hypothetical protein